MEKHHARSLLFSVPLFPQTKPSATLDRNELVEILIVFPSSSINSENKEFLEKFANSLPGQSSDRVELKGLEQMGSWSEIRSVYPELKLMVSMGFSFKDLGLQCSNRGYQLIRLQNTQLIYTDEPGRIRSDKKLKLQLWNQVKSMTL